MRPHDTGVAPRGRPALGRVRRLLPRAARDALRAGARPERVHRDGGEDVLPLGSRADGEGRRPRALPGGGGCDRRADRARLVPDLRALVAPRDDLLLPHAGRRGGAVRRLALVAAALALAGCYRTVYRNLEPPGAALP